MATASATTASAAAVVDTSSQPLPACSLNPASFFGSLPTPTDAGERYGVGPAGRLRVINVNVHGCAHATTIERPHAPPQAAAKDYGHALRVPQPHRGAGLLQRPEELVSKEDTLSGLAGQIMRSATIHRPFPACPACRCVWHEDTAQCALTFNDADWVHFLLWSGVGLACNDSLVASIVSCSFAVSSEQCSAQPGCAWTEAACYPASYSSVVTKPKMLVKVKKQVQQGRWALCAYVCL